VARYSSAMGGGARRAGRSSRRRRRDPITRRPEIADGFRGGRRRAQPTHPPGGRAPCVGPRLLRRSRPHISELVLIAMIDIRLL